jgi:uncharacterized damage-inducible protein DinB
MNTFKSKNPMNDRLTRESLRNFQKQQEELKAILKKAETRDLSRKKIKTTLPLIRFYFSDGLEFVINHQIRHMAQAERALS